jgi:alcohol dehydrogenase (cytochrome c)
MERTFHFACLLATTAIYAIALTPVGIARAATTGAEWEGYNKSLDGERYSPLSQINTGNAADLVETCRVPIAKGGSFQAGLLMVGDTIYATTVTDTVAIDIASCKIKWRHVFQRGRAGAYPVNRGVAYLNGRVYRGTDDGHLIAIDADTGKVAWDNVVGDPRLGECITSAPIAWNGLVITGTAMSDLGVRGRIMAFDALSGREVWRFLTVPSTGHEGAKSWRNTASAIHGGGGTWSTFTIDPVTNELFIPVGNPVPDLLPAARPGENLFTNSVLVLDALTGNLKWWYQLAPFDGLDHDLGAAPMLYRNNRNEDMVAAAGKDGYLHLVNRDTHKLYIKTSVTTVDKIPAVPTPEGVRSCPGFLGGVEWNGPAFDAERMTIFVGAVDYCSVVKSHPGSTWVPGGDNMGGSFNQGTEPATGWISAIDADSGAVRWKFHAQAPVLGGLTPTAGGVLFAGDNAGTFYVFNSTTGEVLKQIATGGSVAGGVITFEANSKQYIALTSGNVSRSVFGANGRPTVVLLALKKSDSSASAAADPAMGMKIYMSNCAVCHGANGKGIGGFDLSKTKTHMSLEQIIAWIKNPTPPMPHVFAEPLDSDDERDIHDVATYLETATW